MIMTLATMSIGLAAVAFALWRGLRHVSDTIGLLTAEMTAARKAHEAYLRSGQADWEERIRDMEDSVERLPLRWDQIRAEAERFDGRARSAIKRVEKELAASGLTDDTIAGLSRELRVSDGGRSGASEMPAVPEEVATPEPQPTTTRQMIMKNFSRG